MTSIPALPFDVMIEVARDNVRSFAPVDPNCARVRYTGGTAGRTGEIIGRIEELLPFRALVVRYRTPRKARPGGEDVRAAFTADMAPEEDVLTKGDEVRWDGRRFIVEDIQRPSLNGQIAFVRALLNEVKL